MAVHHYKVATSSQVIARDELGRFVAAVEKAGHDTVQDMVEEGAALSRGLAPVGHKPQHSGDIAIKDSIFSKMISRTAGYWGSASAHALPQETGSKAHLIVGNPGLRFFWDKEGRMFEPAVGKPTIVNHPGNPAHPFLRPAYEIVMARWQQIAARHYPK